MLITNSAQDENNVPITELTFLTNSDLQNAMSQDATVAMW
jgi:hypothetical protein